MTNCWGESYTYDIPNSSGAWGNLISISALSSYTGCTQESLGISVTPQNQIVGETYDAAGNLITVPGTGGGSYAYNAENQMTSTAGVTYTYDGDGKRVQKSSGTLYWYGMSGDSLVETDLQGNNATEYVYFGGKRISRRGPAGQLFYYVADHLGTSRMMVRAGQTSACYSADFYPFGGERALTNTCPQNYKFTGKERDAESNLDNFGARYDSSSMGRFTSPDPDNAGATNDAPQSWNAYSYVQNNPLNLTDPDGRVFCRAGNDAERHNGISEVCDVTDREFVNDPSKYPGYSHRDYSWDTYAGNVAYRKYKDPENSSEPFIFPAILGAVIGGVESGVRGGASLFEDLFGTGSKAAIETASQAEVAAEVSSIVQRAASAVGNQDAKAGSEESSGSCEGILRSGRGGDH